MATALVPIAALPFARLRLLNKQQALPFTKQNPIQS